MNSVRQSLRIALSRFPPCPLRGTSPKGKHVTGFSAHSVPYKSSSFATPQAGAEQPVLSVEQLMKEMPCEALLCPRLRGKGGADRHQRGTPPPGGIHTGAAGAHHNPHARQGVSMQVPRPLERSELNLPAIAGHNLPRQRAPSRLHGASPPLTSLSLSHRLFFPRPGRMGYWGPGL